jgi:hypothetical protein
MLLALRALTLPCCLPCKSQLLGKAIFRAFAAAVPQASSHYEVLGLQKSATAEEIKAAFRQVSRGSNRHVDVRMAVLKLVYGMYDTSAAFGGCLGIVATAAAQQCTPAWPGVQ